MEKHLRQCSDSNFFLFCSRKQWTIQNICQCCQIQTLLLSGRLKILFETLLSVLICCKLLTVLLNFGRVCASVLGTVMCGLNYSPQYLNTENWTAAQSWAVQENCGGDLCCACRPQPEFPEHLMDWNLMKIEWTPKVPKWLQVDEDPVFQTSNLQVLCFY